MNVKLRLGCWLGMLLLHCSQALSLPSVAFYYGDKVPEHQLCSYDMVVVDPHSNFNPKNYCNATSRPFAYVSVGEVAKNAPYAKKIAASWIKGSNKAWNHNPVLDQTNKDWQNFFLNDLVEPLWKQGYRGFFLDTLDSYFLIAKTTAEQQQQVAATVDLIRQIKVRHPEAQIILNRGFQLLPELHSEVDAVVIESLYHAWNQADERYEETKAADQQTLQAEIAKIKAWNLPIIIIDYLPTKDKNQAEALAAKIREQGMIPWITNSNLTEIYAEKVDAMPRKILFLYNNPEKTPMPFFAAPGNVGAMLEYLGYVPEYQSLDENPELPSADLRSEYAGIIFWLGKQDPKNLRMLSWATKKMAQKIPVVFLYGFGLPFDKPELAALGLKSEPLKPSSKALSISKIDSKLVGFEIKPSQSSFDFLPLQLHGGKVILQLKNGQGQTEDAVAITPWGGYAVLPYVIQYLPGISGFWVINPLAFFKEALRLKSFPIPDVTTENGRRLMSVHVDGDGFSYPSKWIGGDIAAVSLREKVLKVFPIPTSVSVIVGELAPDGLHPHATDSLMEAAKAIFALPWVESASHTFSHPANWEHGMSKKEEELDVSRYAFKIPNYTFNVNMEVTGAVEFINKYLAPKDRKCHLLFWPGLGHPSDEAFVLAQKEHLLNINGDSATHGNQENASLTNIQPMGMNRGRYYQVFAPIEMDYYFTNGLSEPLYGFKKVIETLKVTDSPRRFKPIDIYYHYYSASYPAALQALIEVYRWALAQPVMNIYISEYIRKVLDYQHTDIAQKDGAWSIYNKGNLRELRSQKSFGYPNLLHSQNVLGFKDHGEDRYIHLGPNQFSRLRYQANKPTEIYLQEANARVQFFSRGPHELVIHFQGHMPLEFTMANVGVCRLSSKSNLIVKQNQDNTTTYKSSEKSDELHFNC